MDREKLKEKIEEMEFYPQLLGTFEDGHTHLSTTAINLILALFDEEEK